MSVCWVHLGVSCRVAVGETVALLHPPSPFSRRFNRDGVGLSANDSPAVAHFNLEIGSVLTPPKRSRLGRSAMLGVPGPSGRHRRLRHVRRLRPGQAYGRPHHRTRVSWPESPRIVLTMRTPSIKWP